jgi:hypothetical protein
MTDGTSSEDGSYGGSDSETDEESEKAQPNVGRPREFGVAPVNLQTHQGQPPMSPTPRGPQSSEQAPSLDVLTEIRKMIKEECTNTTSPLTGPLD